MVISVNQLSLYGAVAYLTKELLHDQRVPGKPGALDQMEQEIITQPPLAEVQANEERQGNLLQNYERRFEKKLPADQKLSTLCAEASLNSVEIGQFFYALPSLNGAKNRSFCRDYTLPRDEKENCAKGWIESDARLGLVSDIKVCKTHGRYSVEVVPSLFEDQTTSWIRIVNGVEKYVREAMPIQEEERASGKPAAKARPILKPSLTSDGTLFRWNRENGSTLKRKDPRTLIASRCQDS